MVSGEECAITLGILMMPQSSVVSLGTLVRNIPPAVACTSGRVQDLLLWLVWTVQEQKHRYFIAVTWGRTMQGALDVPVLELYVN